MQQEEQIHLKGMLWNFKMNKSCDNLMLKMVFKDEISELTNWPLAASTFQAFKSNLRQLAMNHCGFHDKDLRAIKLPLKNKLA